MTVGRMYLQFGLTDDAERHFAAALKNRRALYGQEHERVAESLHYLALALRTRRDDPRRRPPLESVLKMRIKLLGAGHQDTLDSMDNLAGHLIDIGKSDEAEPLILKTLDVRRRRGPDHKLDVARSLAQLGYCRLEVDDVPEPKGRFAKRSKSAGPCWRRMIEPWPAVFTHGAICS